MRIIKMKILKWMCQHMMINKIQNKNIREKIEIASIRKKL